MGCFLLRRFVDLVRVYYLLIISRNHSNMFLLLDLQKNYLRSYANKQVAKFLRTPFLVFTEHLPPTASEICTVSFLRIFFISLGKSALLHQRCLMSKFSEMLMLLCRKTFSAFYLILHESFSNSYGFTLLQEFIIFYPHLVLYDRKHFRLILTD